MRNLTLNNIANACHGCLVFPENNSEKYEDLEVSDIVIDSRKISEGALFVPVVGERVDGHTFIPQVLKAGAMATLTEQEPSEEVLALQKPYIQVKSTLQALKDIAKFYRAQFDIPFVGITGSVGKTSTKEMISAVLATKYNVLKTEGNFNNEIGVPLTLFRLREEHEVAVIEMGISGFEEMHRLSEMVRPNVGVITNIGLCHLENLGSRDGILKAKTEMFDNLYEGAHVVLNGDDDKLCTVKEVQGREPVFFGIKTERQLMATDIKRIDVATMSCVIHKDGKELYVEIPVPGDHVAYNGLAATGVAMLLGLSDQEIVTGLQQMKTISGRFNIIQKDAMTIIDDCYNANPVSMKASIRVLSETAQAVRKVAILGDMFELGENERALHHEIGDYVNEQSIDVLVAIGQLSKEMCHVNCELHYFATVEEFLQEMKNIIKPEDTILVKASHGMKFAQIVEALEK